MLKKSVASAALLLLGASVPASAEIVLKEDTAFTAGSYLAYITPFNRGWYTPDKDFSNSITLDPGEFPNRTVIASNWPQSPCPAGVYNFNAIDFGNYNNTIVKRPILAHRVKDIVKLSETHSFTMSGATAGFNVIDQSFLTSRPGGRKTRLFEIDVFLHTPKFSLSYLEKTTMLGTFANDGVVWSAHIDRREKAPVILFHPQNESDLASATVDLKAMFDWLKAGNILSGEEWFNGMAIGMQTHYGSGTVAIERFDAAYE